MTKLSEHALRGVLAAALMGAPAMMVGSMPAPARAQAAAMLSFDIPAQPLIPALVAFSDRSGLQLFFDSALARDLKSPGASGTMTTETALRRLLSGTGMTYRFTNAGTVTLERVATDGAMTLDPVTVEGGTGTLAEESATGPVQGYVAKRGASATKTDTPLLETPQSVSVIGREQLDERNVATLNDALHYTAGVSTYYSNDTRNDAFNIRGFSSDFFYLDGTRLPAVPGRALDQWRIDPYQLERIEVLKGPASVAYGLGEPGGMVSMVSKMPTDYSRGQVDLLAGSYNHFGSGVDMSGPVDAEGRVLYRAIAMQSYSENQVDDVKGTRTLLAPSATFRLNDRTSVTMMASYLRDDTMDSNNFLPYYGSVKPTSQGQRISTSLSTSNPGYENYDKTQYSASYLLDHRFNDDWAYKQNFRYAHLDLDNQAMFGYALSGDQQSIRRAVMNLKSNFDVVDLDNQILGKVKTGPIDHSLLFGFNFTNQNFDDNEGFTYSGYTLNLYNPTTLNDPVAKPPFNDTQTRQTQQQYGFYVQDQMKYDRWILVLSGRRDQVSSVTRDLLSETKERQDDGAFSGRAAAMYLFDGGAAPYASYSSSFQPLTGTDAYHQAYDPLFSRQAEVGVKYQPDFANATFTTSLFDLRQNNTLTAASDPSLTGYVQAGQVRSRGVEFEATAQLTENIRILGAYTRQSVKTTKGSETDTAVGKVPTATPRQLASLWLDYTIKHGPFSGLGFGSGAQYVGATYANADNSLRVDPFAVVDAAGHYDIEHWRFVLSANNLSDEIYVARCGNVTRCQYGLRRNVMLTARYSW
ncbi:TonB-dependent siderophore receptor [Telmatospirillum siberiense]|nr:TonB-dependent siderophore receptor [Telmatospirillum siberiense]